MNTSLEMDSILEHLPGYPWRNLIHVYDQVDSTNTLAKRMASEGAPAGTVLIADRQTGGRGRMGRSFQSPGGFGVYLSVILRPEVPAEQIMHLTCAVAESMCTAVEEAAGFRPQVKWINDLIWEGKKLGGILTEVAVTPSGGHVDYAVVGIGINCRQRKADFDESIRQMACSVDMVSDEPVDRNRLAAEMIQSLYWMDQNLFLKKHAIMESYRCDCVTLGQQISVRSADKIRHGVALDLDEDGALLVAFDSGAVETVNSGEVSIRGLYGYV